MSLTNFNILISIDEFLARKLQEECKKECSSNISNSHTVSRTQKCHLNYFIILKIITMYIISILIK